MFTHLSPNQKVILNLNEGRFVVKACPGSGKTYSVAARIARLLSEDTEERDGIAVLSFTNVACEEIADKLKNDFKYPSSLSYPNFIGTLDSFFNKFIFLPYGSLIMGCVKRPVLVGEPNARWTKAKGSKKYRTGKKGEQICYEVDPDYYFDCVSFDLNGKIIPIVALREFHFSFKNYNNAKGVPLKIMQDLTKSKWNNFKLGFANQSDANYISLQVLKTFPLIAQSLALKFKYFILDEAQDTNEIQMQLIELLHANGAKNFMLIGDSDQSIFEWNNASPTLFDEKFKEWKGIELNENYRSSQLICNFSLALSSFNQILAINKEVAQWSFNPIIIGYDQVTSQTNKQSFDLVMQKFMGLCEENGIVIDKEGVAVLFRGRDGIKYLGEQKQIDQFEDLPWEKNYYFVRELVEGKCLLEKGDFRGAYKLLERGIIEGRGNYNKEGYYCNPRVIPTLIETLGFKEHRTDVWEHVKLLPLTSELTLNKWVEQANLNFLNAGKKIVLKTKKFKSNIPISDIFSTVPQHHNNTPFYCGTIHSAKGRTFEAVLLLLGKRAANKSYYVTMLKNGCKEGEEEELRNIYVAITRPSKILIVAVPRENVSEWKVFFNKTARKQA